MSVIKKLKNNNMLKIEQQYATDDIIYEVIMGSFAYGVSNATSDMDVYGVCVPPSEIIFPHTIGYINGFGPKPENFENAQQHHIKLNDKEYDVSIYSIVKYFHLCSDNNPNMIDSLFVPDRCITHIDNVGRIIRDNRQLFLHKGTYHRFRGYAHSQMSKIRTKTPIGKRKELVEKFGYDVKFSYHLVRLMEEAEQILIEHDLNLEKSKELLKTIRKGEWSFEELTEYFNKKEQILNEVYINSTLRKYPDYNKLKTILLTCIEEHYGSLNGLISVNPQNKLLTDLIKLIDKYNN
jgi:predicted nucleotidyltransferase